MTRRKTAQTVGTVMKRFGWAGGVHLFGFLKTAYTGEETLMRGRMALAFNYLKSAALIAPLCAGEADVAATLRALADCDGTCPGCLEGDGAGCDAIALVFGRDRYRSKGGSGA